ncbi:3-oxoacyl-ACP reductase FabG [Mycolicibacterium wolinskyi]|uniref:Oxidoreductase n=1 Tax=Mycolicibacterium wolinskyi TaxID=59750 RepID=A0A1X2F038_9MYCO|nr:MULTISPECIES: 3-oxoacyl-ACP reductase family protein [Mycolicibacterium]MCV7288529.1 3-oxoacyl-ACP reductase FabG [Mycolicibacterium wolinskyi]MCV7295751.1 3-oxoacyl-ACP reductase FabG [Mycolicibacterium goodii]ORX11757.1 oxidoreductase [Mycolicibacterium wolinskyi]
MSLESKAALVTGGSRGIGAAIARRLAAEGADVAITYHSSPERAATVVDEITAMGSKAIAVQANSAAPEAARQAVDAVIEAFGRLDILVNNAGVFPNGPLDQVSAAEVDQAIDLHIRAPFLFSQAAAAVMGEGGRIITIGSTLADHVPYPGVTLYSATKAAVAGLARGLARDLGPRGITANVVHPGNTDTEMNPADSDDAIADLPNIPLGRYGRADEIAAAVAYLAGPDAQYVNGTTLTVDGGYNA